MNFFHTTEFYVILFVVAAAAVAMVARPRSTGPVAEHLVGSRLRRRDEGSDECETPQIKVECGDDGNVRVIRSGLSGITMSGAVSASIEVKGFDILIIERVTPGIAGDEEAVEAVFTLDFVAPERYHLRYESETTSSAAAMTFRNTPGFTTARPLCK